MELDFVTKKNILLLPSECRVKLVKEMRTLLPKIKELYPECIFIYLYKWKGDISCSLIMRYLNPHIITYKRLKVETKIGKILPRSVKVNSHGSRLNFSFDNLYTNCLETNNSLMDGELVGDYNEFILKSNKVYPEIVKIISYVKNGHEGLFTIRALDKDRNERTINANRFIVEVLRGKKLNHFDKCIFKDGDIYNYRYKNLGTIER